MIKVKEAIVVEGKYDKNTLSQYIDGTIIKTDGFGIFSDRSKLDMLKRIAEKRGLVIFTDSDGAGFVIRNYIKGSINQKLIKNAYIPEIQGKEKRKDKASKEGTLGVEGMSGEIIINALKRAGATFEDNELTKRSEPITKSDLFTLGLTGNSKSSEMRRILLRYLDLPEKLSTNAMLEVINSLYYRDEFLKEIYKNNNLNLQINH